VAVDIEKEAVVDIGWEVVVDIERVVVDIERVVVDIEKEAVVEIHLETEIQVEKSSGLVFLHLNIDLYFYSTALLLLLFSQVFLVREHLVLM
jgi:hypothetical protein